MQSWLVPLLTLAFGGVVGWIAARSTNGPAVRPLGHSATDTARDEIRAALTQIKGGCESFRRDIHRRTMVKDIAGGSLPPSLANADRLDQICWDLAGRVEDGWGQLADRVGSVRAVLVGLRACHAVAVLRDNKAALGFKHDDQDYDALTAKISEAIVRIEACICVLDHGGPGR